MGSRQDGLSGGLDGVFNTELEFPPRSFPRPWPFIGGTLPPPPPTPPPQNGATHPAPTLVHAHLYEPEPIRWALDAGVDVLQHMGSGGNPPYDDALVAEIHRGVPVVQTMAHRIWSYPATSEFPERLQDPRLRASVPADWWQELQRSFVDFERLPYFRQTPLNRMAPKNS